MIENATFVEWHNFAVSCNCGAIPPIARFCLSKTLLAFRSSQTSQFASTQVIIAVFVFCVMYLI